VLFGQELKGMVSMLRSDYWIHLANIWGGRITGENFSHWGGIYSQGFGLGIIRRIFVNIGKIIGI